MATISQFWFQTEDNNFLPPIILNSQEFLKCNIYLLTIMLKLDIGIMVRVFANGPRDLGSIPGRVLPKIKKMVLDASLLNTAL